MAVLDVARFVFAVVYCLAGYAAFVTFLIIVNYLASVWGLLAGDATNTNKMRFAVKEEKIFIHINLVGLITHLYKRINAKREKRTLKARDACTVM